MAQFGGTTLSGAEFLNQQGGRQNSNLVTGKFDWTPTDRLIISVRGGIANLITDFVNSNASRSDIRYNLSNFFQTPREIRFGFRFLF